MFAVLLAACEHEPPPKAKGAPAAGSAQAQNQAPPDQPPPGPPQQVADAGAGSGQPAVATDAAIDAPAPVSQDCVDIAAHIADAMIAETKDAQQKAFIEQEKTKIIRRTAEACTRDSWKPDVLDCFRKSTTTEQMQVCAKGLQAPTEN
jgi:hypothetical protein